MRKQAMEVNGKLIPLMREGVEVVKMILFKKLRDNLTKKYPERDSIFQSRLTGAVVNELFGNPNDQEPFASFVCGNRDMIESELRALGKALPEMKIPLTDALRMQTICDLQEGQDGSSEHLKLASRYGVLINDREMPLPHTFMELSRRLGAAFGLILPPMPATGEKEDPDN